MVTSDFQYDLVVIGSGPGGYVGAIRAAQLGLKVAIVEKDKTYGGTCLNVGCIPSKALLQSSEHYHGVLHDYAAHGIKVSKVEMDVTTMMARKNKVVQTNTEGIAFLFKKNKITPYQGIGRLLSAHQVEVLGSDGKATLLSAKSVMVATGSVPVELPFLKFDEKHILSSTGALALEKVPATMAVVGGGVIGLELGSVWSRLGTKVTVIEYADRLGGAMDKDCMAVLKKQLEKEGVQFKMSTKVTGAQVNAKSVELSFETLSDGKVDTIKVEKVLVSTGRRAFTGGLGCQELGIAMDAQGRLIVDKHYQTSLSGVYAIGDAIPGPMLAHKAEEEGVAVAEILAGGYGHVNYKTLPSVIYTHPEVASVGITEEQAQAQGLEVSVGKFPFMANGRARAVGFTEGFVKIVVDKHTDKILGGHIVGPMASEILGEIVVAMEFGGSSEDLARSFHAHPTLTEVIREAALNVDKRARQM